MIKINIKDRDATPEFIESKKQALHDFYGDDSIVGFQVNRSQQHGYSEEGRWELMVDELEFIPLRQPVIGVNRWLWRGCRQSAEVAHV